MYVGMNTKHSLQKGRCALGLQHRREPRGSQLSRMVPELGSFFTPLKLVEAFQEYDEFFALSRRKYVPPNFAEMRHVLNIAQVCPALLGRSP